MKRGFTLVELMVVVAIIGLLAAVAVPNFKKYQTKTKMSEAKVQLSAVYMVEQTALADHDTYATCLSDLGFEPGAVASRYYAVGFSSHNTTTASQVNGTCNSDNFVFPAGKKASSSAVVANVGTGKGVSLTSFTAGANGIVSSTGSTDAWTINNQKAITWVTQGW